MLNALMPIRQIRFKNRVTIKKKKESPGISEFSHNLTIKRLGHNNLWSHFYHDFYV